MGAGAVSSSDLAAWLGSRRTPSITTPVSAQMCPRAHAQASSDLSFLFHSARDWITDCSDPMSWGVSSHCVSSWRRCLAVALGAGRSPSDGEEQGAPPAFLSNVTPKCPGAVGAEPTGRGGRAQGLIGGSGLSLKHARRVGLLWEGPAGRVCGLRVCTLCSLPTFFVHVHAHTHTHTPLLFSG